jgi:hypothetical protein
VSNRRDDPAQNLFVLSATSIPRVEEREHALEIVPFVSELRMMSGRVWGLPDGGAVDLIDVSARGHMRAALVAMYVGAGVGTWSIPGSTETRYATAPRGPAWVISLACFRLSVLRTTRAASGKEYRPSPKGPLQDVSATFWSNGGELTDE